MRRIYSTRERACTTTSLLRRRTTEALQDCGCSTEKRKNRKRRKIKYAPDLPCATAHYYNNFLATPAHQRRSGKTCGCSAKKAENQHTTESKTCAGLTARGSVLVQQLPCSAGAQRKLCKIAVVPQKNGRTANDGK